MSQTNNAPSNRSRIRRLPELASYQRHELYDIVDAAYLCHIAFYDGDSSHCIPTACWRIDHYLYVHGAKAGRLSKMLLAGTPVSIAISHLDGLVLAKSAFNHSMNYRSAVIYGLFEVVDNIADKMAAMDSFMNKIAPGRQHQARPGNKQEFAATSIMRIPLDEAACKISQNGPSDKYEDRELPVWTGVLPLKQAHGQPIPGENGDLATPSYVQEWAN